MREIKVRYMPRDEELKRLQNITEIYKDHEWKLGLRETMLG